MLDFICITVFKRDCLTLAFITLLCNLILMNKKLSYSNSLAFCCPEHSESNAVCTQPSSTDLIKPGARKQVLNPHYMVELEILFATLCPG